MKDADGNFIKGRNVYTTKTIGVIPVKRPDDRTIRVVIPKKYLGKAATYKWSVYTEFQFPDPNAKDCPKSKSVWETACMDDFGPFRHNF